MTFFSAVRMTMFWQGEQGCDALFGGAGADRFVLSSGGDVDRVYDFDANEGDLIQVPIGAYSVHQVGADAVVEIEDGSEVILMAATASAFTSDRIVQM
jgi:Ca2+-binding RTX toxin-like protein